MKRPHTHPAQKEHTERVTVNVGTFHGTTVDFTFRIEATVWNGSHGIDGVVSVRPVEVHLEGRERARIIALP